MSTSPIAQFWRGASRGDWLAAGAILLLALVAWVWLLALPPMDAPMAAGMEAMAGRAPQWTPARALATFAMWTIMMVAMMLPSAAPIVLLHRRIGGVDRTAGAAAPPTAFLLLGYTVAWTGFAALATAGQWALSRAALLTDADALADPPIAAALLIAAGLYQFAPVKQSCLRFCRSPVSFLMRHYRPGAVGALCMGLVHGTFCVACCWAAMALLFVGGVMNLLWIAALSVFVLIEKALPRGDTVGKALGLAAAAAGAYVLIMR